MNFIKIVVSQLKIPPVVHILRNAISCILSRLNLLERGLLLSLQEEFNVVFNLIIIWCLKNGRKIAGILV